MTITPDHGPVHGGTQVAIRGIDIDDARTVSVMFSNIQANDIRVVHSDLITCRTPACCEGLSAVGLYISGKLIDTAVFVYVEQ